MAVSYPCTGHGSPQTVIVYNTAASMNIQMRSQRPSASMSFRTVAIMEPWLIMVQERCRSRRSGYLQMLTTNYSTFWQPQYPYLLLSAQQRHGSEMFQTSLMRSRKPEFRPTKISKDTNTTYYVTRNLQSRRGLSLVQRQHAWW